MIIGLSLQKRGLTEHFVDDNRQKW